MQTTLSRLSLILFFIVFISCAPKRNTEHEITAVWSQNVQAISNNNGSAASELIDSTTVNYYNQMLDIIVNADSNAVALLRLDQKILVLVVRHAIGPNTITQLNGKKLYARLVQMGMLGDESMQDNIVDNIIIDGNTAKALMIDTVKGVQLPVHFSKEGNKWKLNFTLFYAKYGESTWRSIIKDSSKTEAQAIKSILEYINNEEPDNRIWHPIAKAS